MANSLTFLIGIGTVVEVEDRFSMGAADGLRVRAQLLQDQSGRPSDTPWAFPLLPKTFQSVPKIGEAVLVFFTTLDDTNSQRYYIGPIISQPQFMTECPKDMATSLLKSADSKPIGAITMDEDVVGSFPKSNDVAVVGRGSEDVMLRYNPVTKSSEVDIRAGIRMAPTTDEGPDKKGNVIFNKEDPAYIQVKRKDAIAVRNGNAANSVVNIVADKVNIMSNKDDEIAHNLRDQDKLVNDAYMDNIMDSLHQVPKGDKLVELLNLMKGAIMYHVHPWAGMKQCGDWKSYVKQLSDFDINTILSDHVRIS